MRRALAGVGVLAALLAGCATIPATDEAACDFLSSNRVAARDDDAEARARILDEFDDDAVQALVPVLRPYVDKVVSDTRKEERGRDVDYYGAHIDDALSVCMDLGW